MQALNHFFQAEDALLAGKHILQCDAAFVHLCLAHERHEGHLLRIGIGHLLLHLHTVGVNLCGNAGTAAGGGQFEAVGRLALAKVDEEQAGGAGSVFGIEFELVEHVINAVGTEGDAHTAEAGQAEDAGKVVVASAAGDGADLHIKGFHLEDAAGVVVKTARQRKVELDGVAQVGEGLYELIEK